MPIELLDGDVTRNRAAVDPYVVLLGIGLLVVAVVVGVLPLVNAWNQHQVADDAVETEATVLSTNVERNVEPGNETPRIRWYAQVVYRYEVDDESYTGSGVVVPPKRRGPDGKRFEEREDAEAFLQDYPENATVTAYYLPDDPETSFLVGPDVIGPELAIPIVFALPFGAAGIYVLRRGVG